MAAIDDDEYSLMADILKVCKNGCTKEKIIEETHLSHDQLRRITDEMVDKSCNILNISKSILQQIKDTYFLIKDSYQITKGRSKDI